MSVALQVFLDHTGLPTRDKWQQVLDEAGSKLVLDEFSPIEHTGYLPATLNGEPCGFEYSFGPITADDFEDLLGELRQFGEYNSVVTFTTHGSRLEGRASLLAACALAKLSNGIYFDPQGGDFVRVVDVNQLLLQQDADEREWRMQQAIKKWTHTTERRCPQCGAPCPEYKAKCAVCEFGIGRSIN